MQRRKRVHGVSSTHRPICRHNSFLIPTVTSSGTFRIRRSRALFKSTGRVYLASTRSRLPNLWGPVLTRLLAMLLQWVPSSRQSSLISSATFFVNYDRWTRKRQGDRVSRVAAQGIGPGSHAEGRGRGARSRSATLSDNQLRCFIYLEGAVAS